MAGCDFVQHVNAPHYKAHAYDLYPEKEAELKKSKVRTYFNNHARAKSVRNAFLLMVMLLIEHKQKEIKLQDQFTLG